MSTQPARPEMRGHQPDWFPAELATAQIPLLAYIRTLLAGSDGAWQVLRSSVDVLDGHGYVERAVTDLPATGSIACMTSPIRRACANWPASS